MTLLQTAMAEGRLTVEELEERIEHASQAKYQSELDVLLADLPAGQPRPQVPAANQIVVEGVPELPPGTPELLSGWSDVTRTGRWRIPNWLVVSPSWGTITLNMLDAIPPDDGDISIVLRGSWGNSLFIVPTGWGVNLDRLRASQTWGTISRDVPSISAEGKPHVRVWGNQGYGNVSVRGWRWWDKYYRTKSRGCEGILGL